MFFNLTLSFSPTKFSSMPGTELVNSLYADLPKPAVYVPSTLPKVANRGFTTSLEAGARGRQDSRMALEIPALACIHLLPSIQPNTDVGAAIKGS